MMKITQRNLTEKRTGEPKGQRAPLYVVQSPPAAEKQPANHRSARGQSVRNAIVSHLDDPTTRPIAAALATLRPDGTVDIVAADVEPEFAEALADGLETLSHRLRWHARVKSATKPTNGFVTLGFLLPLALAVAAYFNQIDWLDSAITLAASCISRPPKRSD